jgi:hypothetical protein
MSKDKLKLYINENPQTLLNFADGSGKLCHVVNAAQIHHVYIFDQVNICLFTGYVGWIHTNGLKAAIELIKKSYC